VRQLASLKKKKETNQIDPVTAHGRDPRSKGDPGFGLLPLPRKGCQQPNE